MINKIKYKTLAPGYTVEIDNVDEDGWNKLLLLFNDANIYQTWAYGSVRWGEKKLSHLILKKHDKITAIAQVVIVKLPSILKGIAYIRWGPLWKLKEHETQSNIIEPLYNSLLNEYAIKRNLFLRIVPNETEEERYLIDNIIQLNYKWIPSTYRTIFLELRPSLKELRQKFHKKFRYYLKKSEQYNLTVIEGETSSLFDRFLSTYYDMLNRKKFYEGVDVNEFKNIQKILPNEQKMKILICKNKENIVASSVFSALGNKGIYLLGATTTYGLNYFGSYLLQWKMIIWLKDKGFKYYDLCGINPKLNPGGYTFKSRISGKDLYYIGEFHAHSKLIFFLIVSFMIKMKNRIIYIKRLINKN